MVGEWKKQNNVRRVSICGEPGDVSGETVESWEDRLPELVLGYNKTDIRNMHETRIFWRRLPDNGFGMEAK